MAVVKPFVLLFSTLYVLPIGIAAFLYFIDATGDGWRMADRSIELAEKIAAKSASTVQAIKAGQKIYEREGLAAFNKFQSDAYETLKMRPERTEGIAAFTEKRAPQFG